MLRPPPGWMPDPVNGLGWGQGSVITRFGGARDCNTRIYQVFTRFYQVLPGFHKVIYNVFPNQESQVFPISLGSWLANGMSVDWIPVNGHHTDLMSVCYSVHSFCFPICLVLRRVIFVSPFVLFCFRFVLVVVYK